MLLGTLTALLYCFNNSLTLKESRFTQLEINHPLLVRDNLYS